jgi:acetate kinase
VDLAPLHNPPALAAIRATQALLGPGIPQVAVFDTAFHQTLPERSFLYAIPYELYQRHRLRRYGFHGTSHRYLKSHYASLKGIAASRVNIITMHLGNGCSAAAIQEGKSIDTSMGLTPLEGLVMGSRSGDIDASVVKFLASKENLTVEAIDHLLNSSSGLLGVSGITNDMRDLQHDAGEGNHRAEVAIDMFCYRARKYLAAYLAVLEGKAEAVIFAGGIGENSATIRAGICKGMEWAGIKIDEAKNQALNGRDGSIGATDSRIDVMVIPTNEELMIARDTARCVAA